MAVLLPLWWGTPHYGRVCEPGLPLPLDHLGWYHLVGWRLEIGRRGLQDRPRLSPTRCGGKGHQPSSLRPKMLLQLRQMHWAGWCGALGNPGWVGGMGLHRCRCHWCTGRVPSMPQRPRAVPIWRFLHWSSRYWSWRESCCQERRYGLLRHPSLPLRFFPEPFSPFSPLVCGRPGLWTWTRWICPLERDALPHVHAKLPSDGGEVLVEVLHLVGAATGPLDQPSEELLDGCLGAPLGEDHGILGRLKAVNGGEQASCSPGGCLILAPVSMSWKISPSKKADLISPSSGEGSPLDYIPQQHWGIHSAGLVLVPHAS